MKKNILISGGYDTKNLGDYASLKLLSDIFLKKNLRKFKKYFIARHIYKNFDKEFNIKSFKNFEFDSKKKSFGKFFYGFNRNDNTNHLTKLLDIFSNSKLFIIGNGRLFTEISFDFIRGPLFYYAFLIMIAKLTNTPTMIFSHTIFKLKKNFSKKMLKFIIENCSIVTLREKKSKDNLKDMNINTENVHVLPDAAFGLKELKKNYLTQKKLKILKGSIILNFRFDFKNKKKIELLKTRIFQLAEFLHFKTRRNIVLISQKFYGIDDKDHDDRYNYKKIFDKRKRKYLYFFQEEFNLNQTLNAYKVADFVVTMRRHGLIMALSQKKPCFLISDQVNTDYIIENLNLKKSSINLKNFLKKKNNINQIYNSFIIRDEILNKSYRRYIRFNSNIQENYFKLIKSYL